MAIGIARTKIRIYSDSLPRLQANHVPIISNAAYKRLNKTLKVSCTEHIIATLQRTRTFLTTSARTNLQKRYQTNQTHKYWLLSPSDSVVNRPVTQSLIKRILNTRSVLVLGSMKMALVGTTSDTITKISINVHHLTINTVSFLTGHGPVKVYLHKFGRAGSNTCEGSEMGFPTNAYHEYAPTEYWNIRCPNALLREDKTFFQDPDF